MATTELLFLRDAYLRSSRPSSRRSGTEDGAVVLDRTAFYATGGGQPHDTGTLDRPHGHGRPQGRDRRLARTASTAPAARRRRRPSDGEIDWDATPRPHAHPHRPARAVRRDLERVRQGRHRREHGTARRPAWTSSSTRCPRASAPPSRQRVNEELAAAPTHRGLVPATRTRACRPRPHPHQGQPDPRVGAARSGSSTSSASTSRPTAAPTSAPPTRSGASGSSRPSRRARRTSASGSRSLDA